MRSRRPGDIPSRSNSHKQNHRHPSGASRGHQQERGQTNSHSTTYDIQHTSGLASTKVSRPRLPPLPPDTTTGVRYVAAAHNTSGNPSARQPATFRLGKWWVDGSTAQPARPPPEMPGKPLYASQDARISDARSASKTGRVSSIKSPQGRMLR